MRKVIVSVKFEDVIEEGQHYDAPKVLAKCGIRPGSILEIQISDDLTGLTTQQVLERVSTEDR